MKYVKNLLPGPFPIENYKKNLPYFLSQIEKDNFIINLNIKPKEWKYRNKEITYILNKNYYRTKEWDDIDWKNSIVVLGCSHVFGEGLAEEETLCYQLQQLSKKNVVNLGVTGTSPIFSWHNSLIMEEKFGTPHAVIHVWSNYNRIIYYDNTIVKRIGPWSGTIWDEFDKHAENYYNLYNQTELNAITNFYFISLASRKYWKNKTKFVEASFFKEVADVDSNILYLNNYDLARDDIHYGEVTHYKAANLINGLLT